VVKALLDYEAEFGLLSEYRMDDRLAVLSASRHAIVLMMPADHEWAGRGSIDISELRDKPLVLREKGSATRRSFEAALSEAGIAPEIALEIGSREAVREAVAVDLGLGVIQEPEFGHDPRIARAEIAGADITAGEYIICLAERRESRILRILEPLLAEAHADPETTTP
jgi:DNA-binding transcriptional LysR family regulator